MWKRGALVIAVVLVIAGCAGTAPGPTASESRQTSGEAPRPAGPKRVVGVIQGDPHTLYQELNPSSRVRGIETLEQLVNVGLSLVDNNGGLRPGLAEQVPSTENGLWKLLPDGRMETTWRIREGAVWHDGTPFTTDDLLFTAMVVRDRDIPIFNNTAYDLIERIEAADARTVTIYWKQPFIDADTIFTTIHGLPFPKHVLEKAYQEEKATFTEHPYWSFEFIGNGPFRVKEWVRGSHLIFEANDRYALGRPKIDIVDVRFILDDNTVAANLLAGAADVTLGRNLSGEQAHEVATQWGGGRMDISFENWISLYPQFINPNPSVITDVRFRRALLHAMDRQQIADALQPGLSAAAHSWLTPNQPEFRDIEARNVVRYEYDLSRSAQVLESMGITRGPDGFYRDPAGQRLSLELRTTAEDDLREKMLFAIADFWQRASIGSEIVIIPRQRAADLEYRATFPAFELTRNPNDVRGTRSLHSRYTALPENNFRVTGNRTRYQSAELDGLIDRYFMTIPRPERNEIMGQIAHHLSDQVVIMGIIYNASPTLLSNRLVNVGAAGNGGTQAWNSHEWDIKS